MYFDEVLVGGDVQEYVNFFIFGCFWIIDQIEVVQYGLEYIDGDCMCFYEVGVWLWIQIDV